MDENERRALEEARNERVDEAKGADDVPRPPSPFVYAVTRTLAVAVVGVVIALFWFSATQPCWLFKLEIAWAKDDAGLMTAVCDRTKRGCVCEMKPEPCSSGRVCRYSEREPEPKCQMSYVSCMR